MKLIAISDTHGKHKQIDRIPDGDVIIHAGDITNQGEIHVLDNFSEWFAALPHAHKIFISGNHDRCLDRDNDQKREILKMFAERGLIYLENSGVEIDGVYFHGNAHTPIWHSQWAFNLPRDSDELKAQWDMIPKNTNVLITHGPPYGILDRAQRGVFDYENTGCNLLSQRIRRLPNLKAHIFGHIHSDSGTAEEDGVFYVNAAICNDMHNPKNPPRTFEI
jgi:Icc-related predicted phosphoesterase